MGKVIHWELCKELKIDYTAKWYKLESILENETHKILWDFEIQTDYLNLARRLDLLAIKKKHKTKQNKTKNKPYNGLWHPSGRLLSENQRKRDKYLDLAKELRKLKGNGNTNCKWCAWNGLQRLGKGTGRIGNLSKNRDYPNNSIVDIG